MVANVENMFSVREVPWHRKGLVLDTAPTSAEAIKLAGLDWRVRKAPLYAVPGVATDVAAIPVDDHRAIVRETDHRVLGIVSKRYEPVQNVQAFDFCDPLIQSGKLRYETAGSLGGGKRIWVMGRLGTVDVVPGDAVHQYLLLTFGHDGVHGVAIKPTGVRVVCQNTVNAALADGVQGISLRHTPSVHAQLATAASMFERAEKGFAETVEQWRRMAATQIVEAQLDAYILGLVPKAEDEKEGKVPSDARRANLRAALKSAFERAPGNNLHGVRGTAWAAYNAVTWHVTHEGAGKTKDQERRLDSMWFGTGATLSRRAYDSALALAAA